jgi:TetR/AcrR family transcriptional regulator, lmrAB and yxaGH operons repressor
MSDTRARMVQAAVHALQCDGVAGMSFTKVLAASGAARGAIYHHFPGGKAQLIAEAAAANAEDVTRSLAALPGRSTLDVVDAFLAAVRPVLAASASGGGCAVAAVTVGGEDGDQILKRVAAGAFASWTQALAERLSASGLPDGQASDLATTLIILLEGAHVLCRAEGTLEPFERAARTATAFTQDL